MAAALADVLEAVRASIESSTGAEVGLGEPARSESGLVLLPNKIDVSEFQRDLPTPREFTQPAVSDLPVVAHCLLMPNTRRGYGVLGEGLISLHDNPIITFGDIQVRINIAEPPDDAVAAICSAAGLTLTLAVPLELRWVLGRDAGQG